MLGNGGTTAFWDVATFGLIERAQPAPRLRRVLVEVRRRPPTPAPHLDAPDDHRAASPAPTRRRPPTSGVDVYALTHNETSTGVMMALQPAGRRDGARRRRRHVGRRRAAVVPGRGRRLLLRPAEVLRLRRRAVAGAAARPPRVERIERIAASGRWMPASLDLRIALENSRADQTYNTPALATLFLLDQQLRWMLGQRRARAGASPARRRSAEHPLRLGRGARRTPRRSWPTPAERSTVVGTIDLDGVDADDGVAPCCGPTASSTPTPTASSAATSSASACSRPIDPDDVEALTRCIDHVVERLA